MQQLDSLIPALLMLLTEPRTAILLALLVTASISDYRTYKIPNWLTAGGILFALMYNAAVPFNRDQGLLWAFGGLMVGFLVMLPCYALRIMGAGDVKLMAMVGAFLGVTDTLHAIIYSLIAGGIAALLFAFHKHALTRMFGNLKNMTQMLMMSAIAGFKPDLQIQAIHSVGKLAFGICISIGTITYLIVKQIGFA